MAACAATPASLFSNGSMDIGSNTMSQALSSSVPASEHRHMPGGGAQRFGMFKVPSLVFDIELEDNGIGGGWCQEEEWEEDEIVSEIQRFVQPSTPAEARLAADVRVALSHCHTATAAAAAEAGPRLVSILTALGYSASLRTALGGGDGADCLRNLRHSFITVEMPAPPPTTPTAAAVAAAAAGREGGGGAYPMGGIASAAGGGGGGGGGGNSSSGSTRRYVVDPVFKEQFIIAKTTSRYSCILGAVPQVYVGPEEHLALLVQFLCAEMAAAFRQLGSVLPPWRQAGSMLSKWAPRRSLDLGAEGGGGGGGGGGRQQQQQQSGTAGGMGAGMAAAVDAHCMQLGGGGGGCQQGQHGPWPCRPAAAGIHQQQHHHYAGIHQHQQHHHHQHQQQQQGGFWQHGFHQHALLGGGGGGGGGVGMPPAGLAPMPPPSYEVSGGGNRRQSFEPQRVVFGGNFIPVGPTPVA